MNINSIAVCDFIYRFMNPDNIDNLHVVLKALVASNFNINLVGINGCGKTQTVKENFLELFGNTGIYFTISDFLNKEILFRKFKEFFLNLLGDKIIRIISSLEMVGKYFLNSFKFLKSLNSDMILLSNLKESLDMFEDLSERVKLNSFKNFLQIFEFFREFLEASSRLNKARTYSDLKKNKNKNNYNDYLSVNLFHDKKAYIVIDGIDEMKYLHTSQGSIQKYLNKIAVISNSFQVKLLLISNFDLKASELNSTQSSLALDFTEFTTLIFPRYNKQAYIDILSKSQASVKDGIEYCIANEQIMKISVGNYIDSIANFNSYIYNIHEMKEEFGKSPIKTIIRGQLSTEYIKHDNTYSSYEDTADHIAYIENITNDGDIKRLSPCQKILLISAFLASETDARHDACLFVNAKRTNFRNDTQRSLRSAKKLKRCYNSLNSFDIHRLIAIYSSMICIMNTCVLRQCELNLELIADVNTLVNYNLIKPVNSKVYPDRNFLLDLSRKFKCNVNIELVMVIAGNIGIALEDFVDLEYLNA